MEYQRIHRGWEGFSRNHLSTILLSASIWLVLIFMDVAKNQFFSGATYSVWFFLAQGIYQFLPWFVFSLVCGVLTINTAHYSIRSPQFLIPHTLVALVIALLHIGLLTSNYWVFWPQVVSNVAVSFVFIEQFLKWFHFELMAYAAFVLMWRYRLGVSDSQLMASNAKSEGELASQEAVLLNTDDGTFRLQAAEIDYLSADDNYVILYAREREIRVRSTLKEMLKNLDAQQFVQTHRSAAINLSKVSKVGSSRIELTTGAKVPVSRRRHKTIVNKLNEQGAAAGRAML